MSNHPPVQQILVIKSRHLGDVLLTGPLISTLKQRFPQARISVLVKSATLPMLTLHPHLHAVIPFPQQAQGESRIAFFRNYIRWWWQLKQGRFDWILNTTEGDRGIITGFILGAPRRTSFLKTGKNYWWRKRLLTHAVPHHAGPRHAVLRNLDLIGADTPPNALCTRVYSAFSEQDALAVTACLQAKGWDGVKPLVQIHPVARWKFKCWTSQGMAEIIDHLQHQGFAIGITSSQDPIELQKVADILALCHSQPMDLSGQLTIKQVMAFTARCRFFFGVDTAMMHIAASLDVPVVALFGPSMAHEWGPWPNDWHGTTGTPYPARNGIQSCGPHVVIQKDWPCVPCGADGCRNSKISDCLQQTRSQEVIPLLERVIQQTANQPAM